MVVESHIEDKMNQLNIDCEQDGSTNHSFKPQKRRVGGWSTALLLLGNQGLATLAFVGVEVNLVLFSTRVLQQPNAEAANIFSTWMGTVNLFSLMGAFLSDSYLGRYLTCALFQFVLTTGLATLSLTTSFLLLKPHGCGKLGIFCDPHSSYEMGMFYLSIYLIALGSGAYEPSLAAFASDQFDEEDVTDSSRKQSFFSYFYVATNLGSLISETMLAYIENLGHWTLGFWISTCCASIALIVFLSGTMKYRYFKPSGNPISRFCQVVVAAWRKSTVEFPLHEAELYEDHGSKRITHTRIKVSLFFDRAAIVTSEEKITSSSEISGPLVIDPWRLCTITQVEEVKCVLRLLPVWLCTITFAGIFLQMVSLFVEQGAAMRTSIHDFKIPPASMTTFDILSVSFFIIFYDKLISPLYTKLTKKAPTDLSDLKKIGVGLVFAILGMVIAGLLELQRRNHKVEGNELSSLFILWQIPQYILIGIGEAFVYVGQYDFFGSQTPEGLKSLGIGLSMASVSIGSYVCSLLLAVVMEITRKDGNRGWLPANLNEGHLEKFFFLMAIITAVELAIYIWIAKRHQCVSIGN